MLDTVAVFAKAIHAFYASKNAKSTTSPFHPFPRALKTLSNVIKYILKSEFVDAEERL